MEGVAEALAPADMVGETLPDTVEEEDSVVVGDSEIEGVAVGVDALEDVCVADCVAVMLLLRLLLPVFEALAPGDSEAVGVAETVVLEETVVLGVIEGVIVPEGEEVEVPVAVVEGEPVLE